MRSLSKPKLLTQLGKRHLNLSRLAEKSGISRQSLYQMFSGAPIYNTPFQKLIWFLKVAPEEITEERTQGHSLLEQAPPKIQKAVLHLLEFCKKQQATLVLFGSRARQTESKGSDWDFGIHFNGKLHDQALRELKQELQEGSFPYRVDIVNLNHIPSWFFKSIRQGGLLLEGKWPKEVESDAA